MEAPTPAESTPHRPRKGGRKASPLTEKQRHVVSVRLTDAEHERLNREAERYQLSQGEVLRSVWLKQDTATKLALVKSLVPKSHLAATRLEWCTGKPLAAHKRYFDWVNLFRIPLFC
jgi:hypothetical protein